MGTSQSLVLPAIFALLRYKIDMIPFQYLQDKPNLKFFLLLLLIWGVYTILKHNGLLKKKNLAGQHAFITGGGMGIGRKMAMILAKQNCKITIADVNMEAANKVVEEIKTYNKDIQAMFCDVSDVQSVNKAAEECKKNLGDVDILINNAGIVTGKKLLENTEKGIERTFAINSIAHAYTIRAFLPSMMQRDKGHIVTIASVAGHMGIGGLSDYCGSKFAAVGLDESVRMELSTRKSKVQTTCICPYYINTGMFDGISPSLLARILLPILQEDYAANRIINAIRQNEKMVLMPYFLYLVVFLKSFLPTWLTDLILDITKINKTMDTFKGRINAPK